MHLEEVEREIKELEAKLHVLQGTKRMFRSEQPPVKTLPMSLDEYKRYGRQMVLEPFGLQGQLALKNARVLIIGAGGLGCPVALYLAGAGVGCITIMDDDSVELSNLHRQVAHTEGRIGQNKARSLETACMSLNSHIKIHTIPARLSLRHFGNSAERLDFNTYSLVIDCTDNAKTRYIINDACVFSGTTLVSGGAVGLEGWIGNWNMPPQVGQDLRGPCMRCIYPQNDASQDGNCEDDGVLNTVTGVIGTLMATEAIKLLTKMHDHVPTLTTYSPLSSPMFRNLKLRRRKPTCPGCGDGSSERWTALLNDPNPSLDNLCGTGIEEHSDLTWRIKPAMLKELISQPFHHSQAMFIDLRPNVEFEICSLSPFSNFAYTRFQRTPEELTARITEKRPSEVYLLCRRGNDSLLVARELRKFLSAEQPTIKVYDVRGGLQGWSRDVDADFPIY